MTLSQTPAQPADVETTVKALLDATREAGLNKAEAAGNGATEEKNNEE